MYAIRSYYEQLASWAWRGAGQDRQPDFNVAARRADLVQHRLLITRMSMVQKVTVLGSTGSIGVSTLDVIRRHPERYEVSYNFV